MASAQAVSELLDRWSRGDPEALARLVPLVYDELRRIARRHLARERRGHTLQPTALVNEAYLKLLEQRHVSWKDRAQLLGLAAEQMRRILIDHARARQAGKRGGGQLRVSLGAAEQVALPADSDEADVLALDEALGRLGAVDPRAQRLVELRFYGGLSVQETAAVLDVSPTTVKREWSLARAWLYRELQRRPAGGC